MADFAQTEKQTEIAHLVLKAADKGEYLTLRELQDQLSYGHTVTKQAIQCSLNYMVEYKILSRVYGDHKGEFRRGDKMYLMPTPDCYARFRSR